MRRLVALLSLAAALALGVVVACQPSDTSAPGSPAANAPPTVAPVVVQYWHDATHSVGCWWNAYGLSCLPDSNYQP